MAPSRTTGTDPGSADQMQTAPAVPTFETLIVEVPAPDVPSGAKGIGAGPVCGSAAAVANAVAAATGARFRDCR